MTTNNNPPKPKPVTRDEIMLALEDPTEFSQNLINEGVNERGEWRHEDTLEEEAVEAVEGLHQVLRRILLHGVEAPALSADEQSAVDDAERCLKVHLDKNSWYDREDAYGAATEAARVIRGLLGVVQQRERGSALPAPKEAPVAAPLPAPMELPDASPSLAERTVKGLQRTGAVH